MTEQFELADFIVEPFMIAELRGAVSRVLGG